MSGRQEKDRQTDQKVLKLLESYPPVLTGYWYGFFTEDSSSNTKKQYIHYIIDFMSYQQSLGKNPNDPETYRALRKEDIKQYAFMLYNERRNGYSIRRAKLMAIQGWWEYLMEQERYPEWKMEYSPFERYKMPVVERKDREVVYMTPEEVAQIKHSILYEPHRKMDGAWRYRDLAWFKLGCNTGLRVSAIVNIDLEDIDFKAKVIRNIVEKGNVTRIIPINDDLIEVLQTWIAYRNQIYGKDSGPLFISQKGNRMSVDTIRKGIKRYTGALEKHITPHKMRSTCAVAILEKSGNIEMAREILGHKRAETTQLYVTTTTKAQKEMADMLGKMF